MDIEKLRVALLDVAETLQCKVISEGAGDEGLLRNCVVARKALWNAKLETSLRQPVVRFPPFCPLPKPVYLIIPLENLLSYVSDRLTGVQRGFGVSAYAS